MNTDFIIPGKAEELAAQFDDQAQEMLINYTMLSDAAKVLYVVTVSDLPMQFTDGKAEWVPLRNATTFNNLHMAHFTAGRVVNGRGDRGRVLTLGSAYLDAINHLRDMAAELRASAAVRNA